MLLVIIHIWSWVYDTLPFVDRERSWNRYVERKRCITRCRERQREGKRENVSYLVPLAIPHRSMINYEILSVLTNVTNINWHEHHLLIYIPVGICCEKWPVLFQNDQWFSIMISWISCCCPLPMHKREYWRAIPKTFPKAIFCLFYQQRSFHVWRG